jgi:hypothetical protein
MKIDLLCPFKALCVDGQLVLRYERENGHIKRMVLDTFNAEGLQQPDGLYGLENLSEMFTSAGRMTLQLMREHQLVDFASPELENWRMMTQTREVMSLVDEVALELVERVTTEMDIASNEVVLQPKELNRYLENVVCMTQDRFFDLVVSSTFSKAA